MEYFELTVIILLGCTFSYTNGFQDGSSVSAGPIASRSLTPVQAVLLTALFEYLGALLGGSSVANSISGITSFPRGYSFLPVLAVALVSAISWNFFTRLIKVPSSSTHALVGGLIGALYGTSGDFRYVIFGDWGYLIHASGVVKVLITLFMSPLIGFFAGWFCLKLLLLLLSGATARMHKVLRRLQWLVVPILAFGHGANDTQKVMGLLVLALACSPDNGYATSCFTAGHISSIPLWVRLLVGFAMVSGVVAMAPGIVKRVGSGIYKQRGVHSFVSELASAVVVSVGSATGGPVSASQVIASTVMGVGYAARRKGVHWLVAREMFMAWFLTIPCSGLLAYTILSLLKTVWHF